MVGFNKVGARVSLKESTPDRNVIHFDQNNMFCAEQLP